MTLGCDFAPQAVEDLARLRQFIQEKDPHAAARAQRKIVETISMICDLPLMGRVVRQRKEIRDITIPFGRSGYILRYQITTDKIRVLRLWHGREDRPQ